MQHPEEGEEEPAAGGKVDRVITDAVDSSVPLSPHPVTGMGPPRLSKKNVKGPTSGDRGEYTWTVQWELDKPSTKGGWIVQKVDVSGDIKKSDGTKIATGWEAHVPYWEAWQVHKGQSVTTYAEDADVEDDTFSNGPFAAASKGKLTETGTPEFYEGKKLPASFKAKGVKPAGILPATKSDPGLTGGSGTLPHNLTAKWDSSKGDNTTKVTTA